MALAIEGAATGQFSTAASGSVAITTAGPNRVICVFIHNERLTTATQVASITSPGLTFARRGNPVQAANVSSYVNNIELWWAAAPAQLTAASLSVTLGAVTDNATMIAFAVSGSPNILSPWDNNASLPHGASNGTATNVPISDPGVSTSVAALLIGSAACGQSGNSPSVSNAGYTDLTSIHNGVGVNISQQNAMSRQFASAQSNISPGWTATSPYWVAIVDALAVTLPPASGSALSGWWFFK